MEVVVSTVSTMCCLSGRSLEVDLALVASLDVFSSMGESCVVTELTSLVIVSELRIICSISAASTSWGVDDMTAVRVSVSCRGPEAISFDGVGVRLSLQKPVPSGVGVLGPDMLKKEVKGVDSGERILKSLQAMNRLS